MEAFELDVVVRKKLIQLRGTITPKDTVYANFLKAYMKPKETVLFCLAQKIQYQGCELEQCLLFTLFIIIAEAYNLIYTTSNNAYQISIMLSVFYTLIFCCFANFKYQMLLQVLFLLASITLVVLSSSIDFGDKYIFLGVSISILFVFISKLAVNIQDYFILESPLTGFSLQSNLILFIYLSWKSYEVYVLSNYSTLFSAFVASCLINTVKTYILFQYNIMNVISIFCEQSNKNMQATQNAPQFSQSMVLFVQKKNGCSQFGLNQQEKDEVVASKNQENSSPTTLVQYPAYKRHQSKKNMLIAVIMMLVFAAQIIYVAINQTSSNTKDILTFFFTSSLQTSFLLGLCQCQKLLKSYDKELLTFIFVYVIDVIVVIMSAAVLNFQSTLSLTYESAIFYSIYPLLVIKMFNYINEEVHTELENGKYSIFHIFSLLPFCIRSITLYQGYTMITYLIDAIILIYAIVVLGIWSNRGQIQAIYKQVKSVITAKKKKIKFFDKLKQLRINYQNLVQSYLFLHILILICFYSMTSFNQNSEQISYFIFYFSPLLLYFMCLSSTYSFNQNRPTSYSPYPLTIILLILSIAYVSLGYLSALSGNHDIYSLLLLMNVFLFCVLRQGQKIAVIYLQHYFCFIRVLLLTVFFVFIYLPFVSFFISGYYYSGFSQTYFYYFVISGFFYIWLLITIAGTVIHFVLNLTQKSKKDLFIAQYMENEMKKIGLKENIQKFLMISNQYEILNHKSQDLLSYLKEEKHLMVIIRRQKQIEHDYQLVESDDNLAIQRMGIFAKPINPLNLINRIRQTLEIEPQSKEKENPVLTYFRQKEKARIEITNPVDFNKNLFQIKRMSQKSQLITSELKDIQRSQEFRTMKAAPVEKNAQLLAKFYNFLSEPSECISRQCFMHLLRLLTRKNISFQQADKIYMRFSESSLINQYKFKIFIVDYVQYKYQMHKQKLSDILRTFCCYQLGPLFLAKFNQLDYHLRRKKIQISQESCDIWLKDVGNDQDMKQFRQLRDKQAKKKYKLLHKIAYHQEHINNESPAEKSEQPQQKQPEVAIKNLAKLAVRKQLKDKIFMKPDNIYATIVNTLIECYIFYQKESDNFKIKSIKLSVSNALALATKMSDIFFVFGYSTVYLLIAYFKQDFTGSTYIFSNINYSVLLTLAGASTLLYIGLIIYHKSDFQMGSLGLDEEHRSLAICSLKFFTTQLLFLLGSALANYIISIGLNSLICNQSNSTVFNFTSVTCYGQIQYVYVFVTLMILVVYWPLSAITFPFSTAMDRSLEIKYKSQFEIVYLQFKFLINGYNTLLNPYDFKTQQLINSILKVIICLALAVLYSKMQPCSYELMNKIQGKIYILLTILSFAGALCYFMSMIYSILITGSFIVLYLIYFVYATVKNVQKMTEDNPQDDIIQDNIRNQQLKIKIIKENQQRIVEQNENEDENKVKVKEKKNVRTQITINNDDDQISEVKLTDFPTQNIKKTTPQMSKQTLKFW